MRTHRQTTASTHVPARAHTPHAYTRPHTLAGAVVGDVPGDAEHGRLVAACFQRGAESEPGMADRKAAATPLGAAALLVAASVCVCVCQRESKRDKKTDRQCVCARAHV